MTWDNQRYPKNLVHINWTIDKIFPIKNIHNAIELPKSGHFMIVNKASQIERLIFDRL